MLDTKVYNVEFSDGQTTELAADVIAQSMYAICDTEGNQYLLLEGIIDHHSDSTAIDIFAKPREVGNSVWNERQQYVVGTTGRLEGIQAD